MPKRVPANWVGNPQLVPQDWLEVDPVNRTRPIRLPSFRRRTGEYPILRLAVGATCAPCEQNLRHFATDRNWLSRGLRLAAFDSLLDHVADYAKFKAFEIDIFLFHAEKFSYPKSGSSSKRHSRSRQIIDQALQKELDLFRRKNRWDSGTLGTLTDMTNRIGTYTLLFRGPVRSYVDARLSAYMRTFLFEGTGLLHRYKWPALGGVGIFLIMLPFAVMKDVKRQKQLKYGRRLKGPEMLTPREFTPS